MKEINSPGQAVNASSITEERRRLIFSLAAGDYRVLALIHSLEHLKKRDLIYRWFYRNSITGEKLYDFFKERRFSWNEVAVYVVSRLEKQDACSVLVHKDII